MIRILNTFSALSNTISKALAVVMISQIPLLKVTSTVILISLSSGLNADTLNGTVIGISDGDTLTLLTRERKQIKIRLAEIDTPESEQPYGNRAKQALSTLAFKKQATVSVLDVDRYGRVVGRVYVDNNDVNAELVRNGSAWVYRKYVRDQTLFKLEKQARDQGVGIWALPESNQVPPWEWRRGNKQHKRSVGIPSSCGTKSRCGQMDSCGEAEFYLNQCAVSSLDGDGDGVPCEVMCQ